MKAVLLSVRPKWCELIARGEKTLEVRKTTPALANTPLKVYIYMTRHPWKFDLLRKLGMHKLAQTMAQGSGKVIGEFICDNVHLWNQDIPDFNTITLEEASEASCVSEDDLLNYADGYFFGWHISDLLIYGRPRQLSEFYKGDTLHIDDFLGSVYDGSRTYADYLFTRELRSPPMSWCYVEVLDGT